MPEPPVSVVMSACNERLYVEEAVQSILRQSFGDFEFIIINDGSTDGTGKVLERLAESDDRIRLVHQENQGISLARNRGLSMASGQYVAVMDGDDISDPRRFERQVQFLRSHSKIGGVGTRIEFVDAEGETMGEWAVPTDPDAIAWELLFNSALGHPAVMLRRALLEKIGGYAEWIPSAEDYELWTRLIQVSQLANLPDTLHKLRRHEGSITVSKREGQIRAIGSAATNFHRALLNSRADEQKSKFLVWMEMKGIERAVKETGVQDFSGVHDYLLALHRACIHQLCSEEINIRRLRDSLLRLNRISEKIADRKGWAKGMFYKARACFMAPAREILPWGIRAIQGRIERAT